MASIGTLATLPAETRSAIFEECIQQRNLGLLVSNKRLYDEFLPHLSNLFMLTLHIDPAMKETSVQILDRDGQTWGRSFDLTSPHINGCLFGGMKIDKFKEIRFIIDPPNPEDPGQLVRGWLQARRLVNGLSPVRKDPYSLPSSTNRLFFPFLQETRETDQLPPMVIKFREGTKRRWHDKNLNYNQSVPCWRSWDPEKLEPAMKNAREFDWNDIRLLLVPFGRLRAVRMRVELPAWCDEDSISISHDVERLKENVVSSSPFGVLIDGALRGDEGVLKEEGAMNLWLDYLLDDMKGPTARLLRRDRFLVWCPEFERQLGSCLYGYQYSDILCGGASELLSPSLEATIQASFEARVLARHNTIIRVGIVLFLDAEQQCSPEVWTSIYKCGIDRSSVTPGWFPRVAETRGRRNGGEDPHWYRVTDVDDEFDDIYIARPEEPLPVVSRFFLGPRCKVCLG